MNQRENTVYKGSTPKQMKELAEALRKGEDKFDYDWDSDADRKQFAGVVEKVAELKEICPAIQGSFALRCDCSDGRYHRYSPTLVISEDTINVTGKAKEDFEADMHSTRCELICKQAGVLGDEIGIPTEELLANIIAAAFAARRNVDEGQRMEIRLRTLAGVLPVIGDLIDMKKEAIVATMALALKEIIMNGKDGEEDEGEDEGSGESEEDQDEDEERTVKVVELKGKEADKAIEELLKVLGKKEDKDDGKCGGSCCRKCSKNKNR